MRTNKLVAWPAGLSLLVALLLLSGGVLALSGVGYNLSWWTADAGGQTSSGGDYSLGGTAGQPDAGAMSGGGYTLAGGFWPGGAATPPEQRIYLPLVVRQSP